MKVGIIGLPLAGKSTVFRLLTQAQSEGAKNRAAVGVAMVPDARVDFLSRHYKPRRTAYAQIAITDLPGLEPGRSSEFLAELRDVEALIQVVRVFRAEHVPSARPGAADPLADTQAVQQELVLADWAMVDTRLNRLRKGVRLPQTGADIAVFERLAASLEEGVPLRKLKIDEDAQKSLQGMAFLSDKPCVVVVNTDEEQFRAGDFPGKERLLTWCAGEGMPVVEVCGQFEMELNDLSPEDRSAFLADLGITETGLTRLAKAVHELLGLISFFTVGEDEVKAWTVRQGSTAKEAAGKIHSDIERGFIRAEVVPYESFVKFGGYHAREGAGPRLEGRDYIVQDGNIMHFRFNV